MNVSSPLVLAHGLADAGLFYYLITHEALCTYCAFMRSTLEGILHFCTSAGQRTMLVVEVMEYLYASFTFMSVKIEKV